MKVDPSRSHVAIYTFAEGVFSALAHDLELGVTTIAGEATRGEPPAVEITIAVAAIGVVGVVKRGKTDRNALSASDRDAIERQIKDDVFRGGATIVARGELRGDRARIEVSAPTGRAEATTTLEVTRGDEARARGSIDLSLRAMGIAPVKGPMGAFRVSDKVRVTFDLVFIDT
jgi:hypothetical protein